MKLEVNQNIAFCTIVTENHLAYARVLVKSFQKWVKNPLHVFVVDGKVKGEPPVDDLVFYGVDDFQNNSLGIQLLEKYFHHSKNKYRWSMKPVFIDHLLSKGFEQVFYLDSDLFFYQDPSFLFDQLQGQRLLLSPHWRCLSPEIDPIDYHRNFTHGFFNGGFVGATNEASDALHWWAESCLQACEKNGKLSLYDDQGYLSLLPLKFDRVEILRHKGCNVANWNRLECERVDVDGQVLINGQFPVVFIHFTQDTIRGIQNGEDSLLKSHLEVYEKSLEEVGGALKVKKSNFFFNLFR